MSVRTNLARSCSCMGIKTCSSAWTCWVCTDTAALSRVFTVMASRRHSVTVEGCPADGLTAAHAKWCRDVLHPGRCEPAGCCTARGLQPAAATVHASHVASTGQQAIHVVWTQRCGAIRLHCAHAASGTATGSAHKRRRFQACVSDRAAAVSWVRTPAACRSTVLWCHSGWPASAPAVVGAINAWYNRWGAGQNCYITLLHATHRVRSCQFRQPLAVQMFEETRNADL